MISQDLQDQLSILMVRASLKGKYAMAKLAESNDITLMQALTLCLMEPGVSLQMNSISNFLSCDPSNVTGIVDHLVSCGMIERKEYARDRRIKIISLTEKGKAVRRDLLRISTEKRLPNLASLNPAEIKQLIGLINKATNFSAAEKAAGGGKVVTLA